MWQSDNATARSAGKIKKIVEAQVGKKIILYFPPSSPDLTPLDYAVNSYLKDMIKKKIGLRAKPSDVRYAILSCWEDIPQSYFDSVIDSFPKRLQACVDARGDVFEHLIH